MKDIANSVKGFFQTGTGHYVGVGLLGALIGIIFLKFSSITRENADLEYQRKVDGHD